jgi:hypothetical protein
LVDSTGLGFGFGSSHRVQFFNPQIVLIGCAEAVPCQYWEFQEKHFVTTGFGSGFGLGHGMQAVLNPQIVSTGCFSDLPSQSYPFHGKQLNISGLVHGVQVFNPQIVG